MTLPKIKVSQMGLFLKENGTLTNAENADFSIFPCTSALVSVQYVGVLLANRIMRNLKGDCQFRIDSHLFYFNRFPIHSIITLNTSFCWGSLWISW
jgi:hypothetical protein